MPTSVGLTPSLLEGGLADSLLLLYVLHSPHEGMSLRRKP